MISITGFCFSLFASRLQVIKIQFQKIWKVHFSFLLQCPRYIMKQSLSSADFCLFNFMSDEDPLEKLQRLQREKQCKICMDRDIAIVFIPCAHLVACENCSQALNKCPICCQDITQKIKTYIA